MRTMIEPEVKDVAKKRRDLVFSLVLHGVVVGMIVGVGALFHPRGSSWGDKSEEASAIQATMVNALPLPPRVKPKQDNVLASETPTPAPVTAKEKVEPPPSPTDVPVVVKKLEKTPPKIAEKPQPSVQRPQPAKPQPDRAQSGETGGVRVAMSAVQTRSGTVAMATSDSSFGQRYAYYVQQMKQKISQQWYTGVLDTASQGRRVYFDFRIERDGTPSQMSISKPSGDPTLDQSAMRALQHIDTFGPLPEGYTGRYLQVQFYFEPPQ